MNFNRDKINNKLNETLKRKIVINPFLKSEVKKKGGYSEWQKNGGNVEFKPEDYKKCIIFPSKCGRKMALLNNNLIRVGEAKVDYVNNEEGLTSSALLFTFKDITNFYNQLEKMAECFEKILKGKLTEEEERINLIPLTNNKSIFCTDIFVKKDASIEMCRSFTVNKGTQKKSYSEMKNEDQILFKKSVNSIMIFADAKEFLEFIQIIFNSMLWNITENENNSKWLIKMMQEMYENPSKQAMKAFQHLVENENEKENMQTWIESGKNIVSSDGTKIFEITNLLNDNEVFDNFLQNLTTLQKLQFIYPQFQQIMKPFNVSMNGFFNTEYIN